MPSFDGFAGLLELYIEIITWTYSKTYPMEHRLLIFIEGEAK